MSVASAFKPKSLHDFLKLFPVVSRVIVHWGEMDAFKHVNNVQYVKYQESARLLYFQRNWE